MSLEAVIRERGGSASEIKDCAQGLCGDCAGDSDFCALG